MPQSFILEVLQVAKVKGWAKGSSSSSQHTPNEQESNLDKVDEEDDKGYKSCNDNDDGPMHNENDDYIIQGCITLPMLGIKFNTYNSSDFGFAFWVNFNSTMHFISIMAIKYRGCVYFAKNKSIVQNAI